MRLDKLLLHKNLVDSKRRAVGMIMSGGVLVNGQTVSEPSKDVPESSEISFKIKSKFVSRGGEKLEWALNFFGLFPEGKVCLDIGSSTGGFTDCLLQRRAQKVYCIDVGKGLLHWKLRNNPAVVVIEGTNFRYFNPENLKESPKLVTIDVSFISLEKILPKIKDICRESACVLALVKPQFEVERGGTQRGIVTDGEKRMLSLKKVISFAESIGFRCKGHTESRLKGAAGNIEYFVLFKVR